MNMRTPLGRVRGHGSAHEGVAHWWAQRVTAIALVPLVLWFSVSIVTMVGMDYEAARAWIGAPVNAGLLVLLIVFVFHHAKLGAEMVIEDYVHGPAAKLVLLLAVRGGSILLGLAALFAVLMIAFGK